MLTALEYMKLRKENPESLVDRDKEIAIDEYFEKLGELVEEYPVGRP